MTGPQPQPLSEADALVSILLAGPHALDALEQVAHCERFGWGYSPGRKAHQRRALEAMERDNLLTSTMAHQVDGDGFTIYPERYGLSWNFTEAGRVAWAIVVASRAARLATTARAGDGEEGSDVQER